MKLFSLKKVRVIVSLTFFLAFSLLFLDLSSSVPEKISDYVTYFQFLPSLLKFFSVGTLAASGFIFVTAFTLVFGRVYCSFLCPLGALQDIIAFIRNKLKKIKYAYQGAFSKTRYGILLAVILVFLSGSVAGITLTDPYSHFGRIFAHIVRPLVVWANNTLVFALEKFNIYSVSPAELVTFSFISVLLSFAVLAVILWMSLSSGRLYCNTICPVGSFLGLLSKFSLFKIKFNEEACINCKACEKVCKARCMDLETKEIDFSRCVACYNCFTACPTLAVEYGRIFKKSAPSMLKDSGKRDFIRNTAAFLWATGASVAGAQTPINLYKDSTVPVMREGGITPPGSVSLENFTQNCTSCHLCVTACPTQVLQPAFLEYGLSGIMQPRMDYKTSYCNYDCTTCSSVCPTGAILTRDLPAKKLIQLGRAKFIEKNCVVYTRKTDCGACAEHCPTKAVRMVLDPNINKRAPKIDESICIGCGACEFACPTKPYKSIYVQANPVHGVAQMPKEEKITEKVDLKEEFPF